MKPIRKIAVIGATGMLGLPVVRALADAGFEVTALVRNPDKARRVLPSKVAVVEADVRDVAGLRRGLAGQDAIYLSLSVAPGEAPGDFHTEKQGLENILAAARDAGVGRIGYLSALVHDTDSRWWVIDIWREALARIKASGIAYTIFYPSNFMETLKQRHVVGERMMMLGRAKHPNYWIAGDDYGRQVAKAFALLSAAGREYVIQGPQPLTYDEAAERYVGATGGRLQITRVPLWLVRLGGLFSRELDFNARIMQAVLNYPETFKAQETWDELGAPKTTIEDFARRDSKAP